MNVKHLPMGFVNSRHSTALEQPKPQAPVAQARPASAPQAPVDGMMATVHKRLELNPEASSRQAASQAGGRLRAGSLMFGGAAKLLASVDLRSAGSGMLQQVGGRPEPQPWNPAAVDAFLNQRELHPIPDARPQAGSVTWQEGSSYALPRGVDSANLQEGTASPNGIDDTIELVTLDTDSAVNWCASAAFDIIRSGLPGWASEETINSVLTEAGSESSKSVWAQLVAGEGAQPGDSIQLGEGDDALHFRSEGFQSVLGARGYAATSAPDPLLADLLGDIPPGESRAVVFRPLDEQGNSRDDGTGHWLVVEHLDDGTYRVSQSAPAKWALVTNTLPPEWNALAGESEPPVTGGLFVHTFESAEQVANYVHDEARFAYWEQVEQVPHIDYGVAVLEPVLPPGTEQPAA